MMKPGVIVSFAKFSWERDADNTWSKVRYTRILDTKTKEYTTWERDLILKGGVPEKEYFIRKLNGNL